MHNRTDDIVRRLAERAEEVCRHYLSNGRKIGGYWIVGDWRNEKGRSLYLRLNSPASGKGMRGKWTDYVASPVMLRSGDRTRACGRLPASSQHNLRTRRVG